MPARRPSSHVLDLIALGVAFCATLILELFLACNKFGFFSGTQGSTSRIDTLGEWALFLAGLITTHALMIGTIFLIVRAFHRSKGKPALIRFDFLSIGLIGIAGIVAAKFIVIAYFSDVMSVRLIRDLGGGSLIDPFLFVLKESIVLILIGLVGLIGWWFLHRFVARRAAPGDGSRLRLGRPLLVLAILTPAIIWFANGKPDVRYALIRMTAYGLINNTLSRVTDFDGDGYSLYSAQIDWQPFDSVRHPFALDVPNNGIDEDGYGGDLILQPHAPAPVAPKLPAHPKHLVLIVLESTRADVLNRRYKGRFITPNLNALAANGSNFTQAYSHVGYTTASLKSLFSGALEPRVGDSSIFTDLKAAGYRIGVFSGQTENFGDISAVTSMNRAADIFVDAGTLRAKRRFSLAAKGGILVDEGKLLAAFDADMGKPAEWQTPHFIYFNFQSAHFPYHHKFTPNILGIDPLPRDEINPRNQARLAATYWNATAYTDKRIGDVITRLKALGVWQDTLLVITADHGESLLEDGYLGHGHIINPTQTHIPLVTNIPGLATDRPVGLRDIRARLIEALALQPAQQPQRPVLLYIGSLDRPTAIGMVEEGGVFTTLNFETDLLWFGDSGKRTRYDQLDAAERQRADRLITLWGAERWDDAARHRVR